MRKFTGYRPRRGVALAGAGWNRCECGLPLKRTKADNLVHLHGKYSQRSHDLVMRKKAEAAQRAHVAESTDGN